MIYEIKYGKGDSNKTGNFQIVVEKLNLCGKLDIKLCGTHWWERSTVETMEGNTLFDGGDNLFFVCVFKVCLLDFWWFIVCFSVSVSSDGMID